MTEPTPQKAQRFLGDKQLRRIMLLTFDPIAARLTGSAIRVLELARVLAAEGHEPHVVSPSIQPDAEEFPFPLHAFDLNDTARSLQPVIERAEVLVLPFHALGRIPALVKSTVPLVIDLYDPFLFEVVASNSERPIAERRQEVSDHVTVMNHVLRHGDFFMCASERQRDMWIGALASNGRITAHECGDDSYRHLLDVLPFGIPDTPPKKDGAMTLLRNKVPSIQDTDTVIVSSGALWQWHDAATAVRAIARIAEHRHDIHLVLFAGTPQVTEQPKALEIEPTRALAKELNVLDRLVHFVEDWVPYSQRGQFLLECDAGVSTHSSSLESHFSYRIRILDYLWAGIPAICTDGDVLASFVARHELGAVVPPKDEAALAKKFELIADDRAFVRGCRHRIKALRPALSWHNAAEPLLRYLQSNHSHNRVESGSPSVGDLAMSAIRTVRAEGLSAAARKMHLPGWLKE